MIPVEYLTHLRQLARAEDPAGVLAFADAHLTDTLLDRMTPQQRRLAASATHVAARAVGEGSLGPPSGVPVDDSILVRCRGSFQLPIRSSDHPNLPVPHDGARATSQCLMRTEYVGNTRLPSESRRRPSGTV
jgi:hypothetical protein